MPSLMVEEPAPWLMSVLLWELFFLYLILPSNPPAGELCGLHDSYFTADGRLPLRPPDQDLWEDEDRCRGKCHVYSVTGPVVEGECDICIYIYNRILHGTSGCYQKPLQSLCGSFWLGLIWRTAWIWAWRNPICSGHSILSHAPGSLAIIALHSH